jgi:hypothetical protein
VVSPFRFVSHNHAAFKLCSLWHVDSLLDDFCDSDVARGPPTGSRVWPNDWFSFPALPVVPLSFSCYRLDAFTYLAYSVLSETKDEPRCSSKFLAVRPSDARSPQRWKRLVISLLCCCVASVVLFFAEQLVEPVSAPATCLVSGDSSCFTSLCIGLLARASGITVCPCASPS